MESFFYLDSYWSSETPARLSDFVPYLELELVNVDQSGQKKNVKRRMVEMLKERWKKEEDARVLREERRSQHMMKEMLRRQSHKQGFTRLHAILPAGTKGDKISITTATAMEIMRTQMVLEDLRRTNRELNEKLYATTKDRVASTLRIRVGNPLSGIDSMVEVLHCLTNLGSEIKRMRSQFSDQEFSAEIVVDSQFAENEVEKVVQETLIKVEENLLRHQ